MSEENESLWCPECSSSDVQGSDDDEANAAGFCVCGCCGFAGLSDDFDDSPGDDCAF